MKTYTIIKTWHKYGSHTQQVEKEKVKAVCEEEMKRSKMTEHFNAVNKDDTYIRIEVVNNETGEIREYWNNKQNEILF